ncbi:protein NRT1/ PTR FAMILY 4.5-like [Rhodamnia argentea]|uniref:Protein NRT1/ PTR FAMILY 4.5-like n=1 Tax=Rhodamnia argentea TaxID=178133 RepID=A0A8B8NK37_9MYRT|nr:protein NRT1/ PTR FAMILY 4.5-like [Rhodamnia argentea]
MEILCKSYHLCPAICNYACMYQNFQGPDNPTRTKSVQVGVGDETAEVDKNVDISLSSASMKKGGYRACMFVFGLASLENIGFVANMSTMVLYFSYVLYFSLSTSANTLTNFMGSVCLLSLIGGFISDTYINRLYTCLIFGSMEVVALVMVTIQAYSKNLHPDPCGKSSCVEGGKALFLYTSMFLLALGAGGVKGALPALGGDQLYWNGIDGGKALASYFNWYLLSTILGGIIGVTGVVWVNMNKSWYWGFFIGTMTALLGFIVLAIGKPFYRFPPHGNSPLLKIAQVIVVSIRNRHLTPPVSPDELYEISEKERDPSEEKIPHTDQFRFLDKAAILCDGTNADPWKVCTVTQVEEVKVLTRMLPILFSTIIMNTCMAQLQTFSVQQGYFMDPYIGSFKFPTASIPVIPLFFMSFLIPSYQFVFVPFARKITGHPTGITQLQRVGVGLVLSIISMSIAGLIEVKRRNRSIEDPLHPISLFWLSFQYGIFGIADMFTVVGLLEFFYKEAPLGMRSLSTSFTWLSLSFGYFLSTIFVNIINSVTRRIAPSKQGWLHGKNLNSNKLNLFYWFLAVLSCLNLANYVFWASWYKYKIKDSEFKTEAKSTNGQN